MNNKINVKKILNSFYEDVLVEEKWFSNLIKGGVVDLLLITGSHYDNSYDDNSDIDLFVICSQKTQRKFKLKPIYVYSYDGVEIEISMFTKENLINASKNKDNIFRWKNTGLFKVYNKGLVQVLKEASKLSAKQKKDWLWTNYVNIKINQYDMKKQLSRKDQLSVKMLLSESIVIFFEAFLLHNNTFSNTKQMSFKVNEIDKNIHKNILINLDNTEKINKIINRSISVILKENGFTDNEIKNWDKTNLTRLLFQYK